ncbi:hypothetical protein IP88_14635 [alpha proteobacterium AAP81b]|nr:hypothetical protein IP88_14635 [alpha proteobacterium AAP81b]
MSRAWTSVAGVALLGSGCALPGEVLDTDTLIGKLEARFGFRQRRAAGAIAHRLGIHRRHSARDFEHFGEGPRPGDGNPDLAARAVTAALAEAGLATDDLGYLIGHTATPAQQLPSNIALVADRLRYDGPHAEFRQACTGFANALAMAIGLLGVPGAAPVAIVGSETGSPFLDPRGVLAPGQLVNLVQMGDAAAAVVLARADWPGAVGRPMLSHAWYGAIGRDQAPGLELAAGGSARPDAGMMRFEHDFGHVRTAGAALFGAHRGVLAEMGLAIDDAALVVPHQANGRIAAPLAELLGLHPGRVFVAAGDHGNTGSAAIWLAVDAARRSLAPGESLLALGAEATKHMYGGFRLVA